MERYSLREAQHRLRQLIDDARHGKTVLILDENEQAVQLVPVTTTQKPRKAGTARGLVKMAPNFDEPLADFDEYMT
jgi:antitoxin (DNA-binding transcriptional repressor) of toxin-antitoxin stability system